MPEDVPLHPGVLLKKRFLDPLGVTIDMLASGIGLPVSEVGDLVTGKHDMTPEFATRLGLYLDVPTRWWLEMQARFDGHDPERRLQLGGTVTPFDGLDRVLVTPAGVRLLGAPTAAAMPIGAAVTPEFVARLRAQVRHAPPRTAREPTVVYFEDGTPCLTGT